MCLILTFVKTYVFTLSILGKIFFRYYSDTFVKILKQFRYQRPPQKNSGVFRYLATVTETRERVGRGTHTVCIYIHSMCVCMCDGYVDEREVHPEEFNICVHLHLCIYSILS